MKRKTICFTLILLLLGMTVLLYGCGEKGGVTNSPDLTPEPELFKYTYTEEGTYAIAPKSKSDLPKALMLPDAYNGIPVTAVKAYAFMHPRAAMRRLGLRKTALTL